MESLAPKLYKRLGGYDRIYVVVKELMDKMENDARLARYFAGHGEDSKMRLLQLQVEMICQVTGGDGIYLGRDMKTVHKGIGISGSEWGIMISYLIPIMHKYEVPDQEQREVQELLNRIKGDIVEKP